MKKKTPITLSKLPKPNITEYGIGGKKVSEQKFFKEVAKDIYRKNHPPKPKPKPTLETEQGKIYRYLNKAVREIGWKNVYFILKTYSLFFHKDSNYKF